MTNPSLFPTSKRKHSQIPAEYLPIFARLSKEIEAPSEGRLTVRCWSDKHLRKLIKSIIDDMPSISFSARTVVQRLQDAGLARSIETIPLCTSRSAVAHSDMEFYVLGLGVGRHADVDPLELLQAFQPQGILCGLSAIVLHELTTQVPSHHHVARIVPAKPLSPVASRRVQGGETRIILPRDPLGTAAFKYQGVKFYLNKRTHPIAGVQIRVHAEKTRLRVTNLEQTLLDTLEYPAPCGGEAIIHEAWDRGLGDVDQERMASILSASDTPLRLLRRLGAMLDLVDYSPGPLLTALLATFAREVPKDEMPLPLLPGGTYPGFNPRWRVQVP
jgi:hypothetical protein